MTDLPKYRSHKIVGGAKISEIDAATNVVTVELPTGQSIPVRVSSGWARKVGSDDHDGSLGYLVQYDDGYMSWSPSTAFEAGYRAVAEDEAMNAAENALADALDAALDAYANREGLGMEEVGEWLDDVVEPAKRWSGEVEKLREARARQAERGVEGTGAP